MKTAQGKDLGRILLGGVISVFVMGSVWAQPMDEDGPGGKGRPDHGKRPFAEIFEKLKLTKDQKARLDASREEVKKQAEELRDKMGEKHKELGAALDAATLDMNKVTKVHAELKALIAQREDQRLAAILEVRKVLTPQQFAEFQKIAGERKAKWQDKPGKREGKPRQKHDRPDDE